MLAASPAKHDFVFFRRDLFKGPELGVELSRSMKIANTELDAADADDPAMSHSNLTPLSAWKQGITIRSKTSPCDASVQRINVDSA
jgi:hypothetical protein